MPNPGELFPLTPPHPMRGPHCPSPYTLEEIAAGELPPSSHVFDCPDCGGYLRALTDAREDHNARHPVNHFVNRLEEARPAPRRWSWVRALALTAPLAAIAAALVVTVWPRPELAQEVRWKGTTRFTVLALSPGATEPRELGPGGVLAAGDSLRFQVTLPGDGYLAILDVDGAGKVTVFHPYEASRAAPVSGGSVLLPGSIVVDDAPGPETLYAIFRPEPFDLAPLLAQLRTDPQVSPSCDGCTVRSLRFDKQR